MAAPSLPSSVAQEDPQIRIQLTRTQSLRAQKMKVATHLRWIERIPLSAATLVKGYAQDGGHHNPVDIEAAEAWLGLNGR